MPEDKVPGLGSSASKCAVNESSVRPRACVPSTRERPSSGAIPYALRSRHALSRVAAVTCTGLFGTTLDIKKDRSDECKRTRASRMGRLGK
jgi:hypothetical protein